VLVDALKSMGTAASVKSIHAMLFVYVHGTMLLLCMCVLLCLQQIWSEPSVVDAAAHDFSQTEVCILTF
jgi:succinate dehydrogenase hydrophobic anchor subunit